MTGKDSYTRADLERYLEHELGVLEQTSEPYRITHTVQVTSFGGSGTSALCEHLLAAGVDLQPGPGQWPFKHRRRPPMRDEIPAGFRVVYVIGDPRDAVLSIFRRGLQVGHYGALHGKKPDADVRQRLETLETYLAAGIDDFALTGHLDGWLNHPEGYPVLFVRYEALSTRWADVAAFIELPKGSPPLPTKTRTSDRRTLRPPLREQLEALYGNLATRIERLPPTLVVERPGGL